MYENIKNLSGAAARTGSLKERNKIERWKVENNGKRRNKKIN